MITRQIYQWELTPAAGVFDPALFPPVGGEFSIFTGGFGTNITNQPEVLEDQFIVIDNFGSTSGVCSDVTALVIKRQDINAVQCLLFL